MSRLERLVVLLETGSTPFIRNTAADQLSDLAKGHPEEILNLLGRVYPFLRAKKWETRIAAARAFGGIVNHAEVWDPNKYREAEEANGESQKNSDVIMKDSNEPETHDNVDGIVTTDDDSRVKSKLKPKIEELDNISIKIDEEEEIKLKLEQERELKLVESTELVNFNDFNLYDILKNGKRLLASGGLEYEAFTGGSSADSLERLKRQRNNINASLGIGGAVIPDVNDDLLETNDLNMNVISVKPENDTVVVKKEIKSELPSLFEQDQIQPDISSATSSSTKSVSSARLRAMARRKAKVDAKNNSNKIKPIDLSQSSISRQLVKDGADLESGNTSDLPPKHSQIDITTQQGGDKIVVEHKAPEIPPLLAQHAKVAGLVWPFQGVYELLLVDLFSPNWEIRHGSALGLRELIKKHGCGAGRVKKNTREENNKKNMDTLEDLSVRLCTLFALDRFGDYISDTVVAPVRESSAQTLAALLIHLDDVVVVKTFDALTQLVLQNTNELDIKVPCWEASHGGMLGLRYFVGVRTDILFKQASLLDTVVKMVLHGLKESDDDVQAVAAATLTPIAADFVKMKGDIVHTIITTIWDCLTNLKDDLSASIGSVMDLLAKLCTHKEVLDSMKRDATDNETNSFELLVPRLFPFLRHSITNIRKAVLRTLLEFLSIEDKSSKGWITGKSIRLIFQNLLVEQNQDVLKLSVDVYNKILEEVLANDSLENLNQLFYPNAQALLTLLMTPIGLPRHNYQMNTNLIIRPSGNTFGTSNHHSHHHGSATPSNPATPLHGEFNLEPLEPGSNGANGKESKARGRKRKTPPSNKATPAIPIDDHKINIDAPIYNGDVSLVGVEVFVATRIASASAYGKSLSFLDSENSKEIFEILLQYLKAAHSTPRLFASMIIQEYSISLRRRNERPSEAAINIFLGPLTSTLSNPDSDLPYYRELVPILKSVRSQCLQLFGTFTEYGKMPPHKFPQLAVVVQGELEAGPDAFSIESAQKIITEVYAKLMKSLSPTYRMAANQALEDAKHRIKITIDEASGARLERSTSILSSYAAAVVSLSGLPKKLNPIIRSLMDSVKSEELKILQVISAKAIANLVKELTEVGKNGASDKIVKNLCAFLCVDTSEVPEFKPNVEFTEVILSLRKEEARTDPDDIAEHERAVHVAKIKRNGARLALESLLDTYGPHLFEKVPRLKEIMLGPLSSLDNYTNDEMTKDDLKGQAIVDALGVLRALIPKIDSSLYNEIIDRLPSMVPGLKSDFSVFRYSTAKCLATMCATFPSKVFPFLIKSVLPMLNNAGEAKERQGAIESIYHLSTTMGSDILPYIVFLIVPVLGRMSDSDKDVRILATTTFASIIKLVPLEAGIPDPEDMPVELLKGRDREREFIQQMMDPTKVKSFDLPVTIKASLRKYQQEGVNWLAFLNKYHLHGILCDDMGLGKTLQTICIVSSDHHIRAENFAKTNSDEFRRLPSLIVCPPSLTGHWEQEINQYAPFLAVLVYAGGPSVRATLRGQISKADVVVTSYDVARNDVEYVTQNDYNYCVLDEGHIIKNAASKLTKSVKRIRAEHRLILSGTPIQNNVLELWSLFDFLMPGFLGTEKVFQEKFAKPIAASRNSKTSSKEQEAGALALESLHKQVLPFMLRRLKEDVLSDLPPKIIQDYYCELSELQKRLYKDFTSKQKTSVEEEVKADEKAGKTHIFQALQYMRKLCNHPALVVSPSHPQFEEVEKYLSQNKMTIRDINHAPKLISLKTLLLECGIGANDVVSDSKLKQQQQLVSSDGVISQHRALIFCQLKDMLDMVENDLFKKYMPSVTYMRLDGSTDPRQRQDIVRRFNDDPSIDVLLLTTKVGGLGLNLTGADTVIFVEHDWNPMNDLQAMDRAHRLGQKKVVNVYRLITKNTLEEKIMGLQKFKMNIASTIVNQQNTGLASMDTNQLLDLFDVEESAAGNEVSNGPNDGVEDLGIGGQAGAAVGELAELWDESQYEEEYNLDNFIKTLK